MTSTLFKKRIKGELRLLKENPSPLADAYPDPKDPKKWYFLIIGPPDTPYAGGYYLGQILLPDDYPKAPPDYIMLTPSGRFIHGKKICLTNSGFHKESHTPLWNIKSILLGISSIMADDSSGGVAHITTESESNRKKYCDQSYEYNMNNHTEEFTKFTRLLNETH